ncbi:MAG: hypothetical protein LH481_13905, partial [Burkholderiales bacterium]|nr:hypothetical protein [Burkholderiales bacterium]
DTLIVGSSAADSGISPSQLSGSAFNLANAGQTPYYDDKLVTKAIEQLPKLRRVIIAITYISFEYQIHDSPESWRQYLYHQVWGISPQGEIDRMDIRMWSRAAFLLPQLLKSLVHKSFANLAPNVDVRGFSVIHGERDTPDLGQKAAQVRLAVHHGLMKTEHAPANIASLEHLLSILQQQNVQVVVVAMPVWHTYADAMRPLAWAKTESTLERMTKQYGARYLSFLSQSRLESRDFLNLDHLNERGAIRFTQMLNAALESPRQE